MKELKEARVLVTGGAGFIGFHLCRRILEQGANVIIYDNLSTGMIKNVKDLPKHEITFIKGDIRHLEKATKKLDDRETIFHLAAQCNVAYSMKNPHEDYEINALGTLKVLEEARKIDAKVIYASTSAVYGNPTKTPTPEDHSVQAISFYGLSKHAGEEECLLYKRTYNLPVIILRLFNIYGNRGHGVVADFSKSLRKNPSELKILGTGNQSRDFIWISDVIDAFLLSFQSEKATGQTYNIGSGTNISVRKLAETMIELLGLKSVTQVSFTGGEAWAGDLRINFADNSKAQRDLNWRPKVNLTEGLTAIFEKEKA